MRAALTGPAVRRLTTGGLLLGLGLGGFVDGIVLHQILQWHHMLSDYGSYQGLYPDLSRQGLEDNTLWDGLFHAATWVFVVGGLFVLWPAMSTRRWPHGGSTRHLVGLLLAGWGLFNLVEGLVDHHLLGIHHVRDDVADPLWWDLGFLALGFLLLLAGTALARPKRATSAQPVKPGTDI